MDRAKGILVASETDSVCDWIYETLSDDYNIMEVNDASSAIKKLASRAKDIYVVVIDADMNNQDAFLIMEEMNHNENLENIPVIALCSQDDEALFEKCYGYGVVDVISMPTSKTKMRFSIKRAGKILESDTQTKERSNAETEDIEKKLDKLSVDMMYMIGTIVEFKGMGNLHIKRVKEITKVICDAMRAYFPECNLTDEDCMLITDASSLHDIGKVLVPDSIIMKPLKLTNEEFEVVKSHTTKGCDILSEIKQFQSEKLYNYCYEVCRYHHERYDGKGYPEGLRGENIPLSAQIVSIADAFDALTTSNTYRKAIPFDKAYSMVLNGECGMFSPRILQVFKLSKDKISEINHEFIDPYLE